MFGLFKTESEVDKLRKEYRKLLDQAHKLSTSNRTESDKKMAEADAIMTKIEQLKKNGVK